MESFRTVAFGDVSARTALAFAARASDGVSANSIYGKRKAGYKWRDFVPRILKRSEGQYLKFTRYEESSGLGTGRCIIHCDDQPANLDYQPAG